MKFIMAAPQRRPLFSTATTNRPKAMPKLQASKTGVGSSQEYLDQLDPTLKLNKGGFTAVGADTSSNRPYSIAGAEPIAVTEAADQMPLATPYNQGGDSFQFQMDETANNPFTNTPQDVQPNIEQFFSQLDSTLAQHGYGTAEAPQLPYGGAQGVAQMNDGGVLFNDGMVRYNDGTERQYSGKATAKPIRSEYDGSVLYDDGSRRKPAPTPKEVRGIASAPGNKVLQSDGTYRNGPYLMGEGGVNMPGGTKGLINSIFGQDRTITQPYGNINPIEPTRGHVNTGTDLRTADLKGDARNLKLPVGAKVIGMFHDDGTRFGSKSGHQGYGNSLLLQLPSGERLRFSHLSQMGDYKVGDEIQANEVFGKPGASGNTYGEHLDLEYYDTKGKIANPANFSGFTNPQSILPNQPTPGAASPGYDPRVLQSQQPQQNQPQSQPQQQQAEVNQSRYQAPQPQQQQRQPSPMLQAVENAPIQAANAIDKISPTGKFGLGATEFLRGDKVGGENEQRNTIEAIGTGLNAPELKTNELSQSQGTNPFRQLAGNIADVAGAPLKKLGYEDKGISEFLAGGKTTNSSPNTNQGTLGQNINSAANQVKSTFSNAVAKPIEGVNKLKSEFQNGVSDVAAGFNQGLEKLGVKRKIGEESGGDQNILGAPADTPEKNDIRDPFFKLGGAETYGQFLNKNAIGDGGLSLDLFTPDFYKEGGNVANVFGSSHLLKPAQDKFVANESAKYPKQGHMGYEDGYDRGAIDDYNKQVDEYNAGIDRYLSSIDLSTKTPTYGETLRPTQSVAPGTNFSSPNVSYSQQRSEANPQLFSSAFRTSGLSLNAPDIAGASASINPSALNFSSLKVNSPSGPSRPNYTPAKANYSSQSGPVYVAPARSSTPAPAANTSTSRGPVYTPPPKQSAPVQQSRPAPAPAAVSKPAPAKPSYTPANANTSTSKGAVYTPPPQNKQSSNIFSSAVNAVKKLFGR